MSAIIHLYHRINYSFLKVPDCMQLNYYHSNGFMYWYIRMKLNKIIPWYCWTVDCRCVQCAWSTKIHFRYKIKTYKSNSILRIRVSFLSWNTVPFNYNLFHFWSSLSFNRFDIQSSMGNFSKWILNVECWPDNSKALVSRHYRNLFGWNLNEKLICSESNIKMDFEPKTHYKFITIIAPDCLFCIFVSCRGWKSIFTHSPFDQCMWWFNQSKPTE